MGYYCWINNGLPDGVSELYQPEVFTDNRYQIEISEEVYNNYQNNKYYLQGKELVINPQYDKDIRIAEIKQLLDELDLKSIRALRGGDTEYLERYESEAQTLRNELRTLCG